MSARSICIAITVGAAGFLLAGCGVAQHAATAAHAPKPGESPQHAIQLAASHAAIATSFAASFSMNATADGTSLNASGTLEEQVKPLFADMTFTNFKAGSQSLPGGLEEIITPAALYMRISSLSQATGKTWVKIPVSELGSASGLNVNQLLQQAQNSNPLVQTQLLAGAADVRTVGTSVLAGVPVTEYTGSYPMTSAIAHLPASERAKESQLVEQAGIASVDFKVWLDGQHQVRKMIITEQGSMLSETITMTLTGINQQINTALPPSSDTATLPASALKG